jgi:hypothetical protein
MVWKPFRSKEPAAEIKNEPVIQQPPAPQPQPVVQKEKWILVDKYPTQDIKKYRADDGTIVNLITEEDYRKEKIMRELNGEE